MRERKLNQLSQSFTAQIKSNWQAIFFPGIMLYAISLIHFFYSHPSPRITNPGVLKNIDLLSFILAIGLAVVIFNLKRKYFSPKFSRQVVEASLKQAPDLSVEELITKVFKTLHIKLRLVWMLGAFIILEGIIFYWSTYISGNMHIYFVIGGFSLLINYPRKEMFQDIPWYVLQAHKDYQPPAE